MPSTFSSDLDYRYNVEYNLNQLPFTSLDYRYIAEYNLNQIWTTGTTQSNQLETDFATRGPYRCNSNCAQPVIKILNNINKIDNVIK